MLARQESENSSSYLENLPPELMNLVVKNLHLSDLESLVTSKKMKDFIFSYLSNIVDHNLSTSHLVENQTRSELLNKMILVKPKHVKILTKLIQQSGRFKAYNQSNYKKDMEISIAFADGAEKSLMVLFHVLLTDNIYSMSPSHLNEAILYLISAFHIIEVKDYQKYFLQNLIIIVNMLYFFKQHNELYVQPLDIEFLKSVYKSLVTRSSDNDQRINLSGLAICIKQPLVVLSKDFRIYLGDLFAAKNLAGIDISNGSIKGEMCTPFNISRSNLACSIFNNSQLKYINFRRSNFTGSELVKCNMDHIDLTNAYMISANLKNTIITNSNLTGINFTDAVLDGCTLPCDLLTGANFTGASLIGTKFTNKNDDKLNLNGVIFKNNIFFKSKDFMSEDTLKKVIKSAIHNLKMKHFPKDKRHELRDAMANNIVKKLNKLTLAPKADFNQLQNLATLTFEILYKTDFDIEKYKHYILGMFCHSQSNSKDLLINFINSCKHKKSICQNSNYS